MKDVFWYESSEVKVPLGKALGSYLYNTQQQCHELSKNKQNSANVNGNKILKTPDKEVNNYYPGNILV